MTDNHEQYRAEVEQRWGAQAAADADTWWAGLTDPQKDAFGADHQAIAADWQRARQDGLAPDSDEAQAIARRHMQWITVGWQGRQPSCEELLGLAHMYVADDRFAANYGGQAGAAYVRDALGMYAEHALR